MIRESFTQGRPNSNRIVPFGEPMGTSRTVRQSGATATAGPKA